MPDELPSIVAGGPLPRLWYARPTIEVARDLLGKVLVNGPAAGRITEVEAYVASYEGQIDRAAHSSRGVTDRTRVLFGEAGHAYVYFIYGTHHCLNVVTEPAGQPGCVLIRAVDPLAGIETMRARRLGRRDLTGGPGKLAQAFGITRKEHNGVDLTRGPLTIHEPRFHLDFRIKATPRIGIRECADWPLRFLIQS